MEFFPMPDKISRAPQPTQVASPCSTCKMTDAERREKNRLRSERWRRAHGIGPRRPAKQPWLAEGVSRSTWYRRKQRARQAAAVASAERREKNRLRSERWRRAHGIGPRRPAKQPWLAEVAPEGAGSAPAARQ